jgi:hypothetical protein
VARLGAWPRAEEDEQGDDDGRERNGPEGAGGERPDKAAAARDPKGDAEDRPGFDLGGAVEPENKGQSQLPPRGPAGSPAPGDTATGRATGLSDPSGSRSLGNDGAEPGSEAGSGPTEGSRGPR